ncbi:unnamed protein product [Rotaria magnacalcarata]|uniref:Uncharacterized protein n=1 Tax=Rotaria magnacalcarata TaxID=392030 RepID=A0A819KQN6_9BILA|nr:unnamed protein product [Rotaria magnacalcarata]CAF4010559.1 unnamed protein product [Rotaria magnacalcarata]CAF4042386.1 unnamed protein product [Rotaria magnacalcarata]
MPLALSSTRSSTYNVAASSTTPRTPTSVTGNICPNAIWNGIEEAVVNSMSVNVDIMYMYASDFYMDAEDN